MNKLSLISTCIALSIFMQGCNSDNKDDKKEKKSIQYVNTLIGSADAGHTFPGVVVPSGMVQLSPDTQLTGWHSSSGYHDDSDYKKGEIITKDIPLYGFSHTHLSGTGIGGLGDILFLPYSDNNAKKFPPQSEMATFSKDNEKTSPGYYEVTLDDSGIIAELTASERVGYHRYTFPKGQDQRLKIDLNSTLNPDWGSSSDVNELTVIDDYTIVGERDSKSFGGMAKHQRTFFYVRFNHKIISSQLTIKGKNIEGNTASDDSNNADVTAYIEFEKSTQPLLAKVGISAVSLDGAENNLAAENDIDFNQARKMATEKWSNALDKISVKGGTEEEKTIFYTALYHTDIAPMVYQDTSGEYRGMAHGDEVNIYTAKSNDNYSVYSLWDTFRSLHPLKTIVDPKLAVKYAKDLIRKQQQGGLLPKWELHGDYTGTMVGYPAVSVIADALVKYPNAFSQQEKLQALEAAIQSSNYHPEDFTYWNKNLLDKILTPHMKYINDILGWAPAVVYDDNGVVINGTTESVSYGLENSYYDWCIAQIAKLAGEEQTYQNYMARSKGYKKYFDYNPNEYEQYGTTGFMRPKLTNGAWKDPFEPYDAVHQTGDYTEGNAWQWTWFVPHDIQGLKSLMGGEEAFLQNLNALFNAKSSGGTADMTGYIGQYIHGNEPDHHVVYLYNFTSEPWKTQEYVDKILHEFYTSKPDGIIGNEDVGAMSAWYVMSAMGFYEVTPGSATYTVGRPLFDKVIIPVEGGLFTVIAENNNQKNLYIKSVEINGKPLTNGLFFKHSQFKAGGELKFVMTNNKDEAIKAKG
ncbi:putative alpha-1,2-mannosidase [Photobacterium sp. SKA34]|nr:GH92 family glycosyl hydrolase [Photobacterium sp. SKA34]EAR55140.1 putative alpha-1,2-mannosidase [Photobacterium sp. SKA34]